MIHIVKDGFFNYFDLIKNHFKSIPLYTQEEYKKFEQNVNWPGQRSLDLEEVSPFLNVLIIHEINRHFEFLFKNDPYSVRSYIHLRLDNDNKDDWIHKDNDTSDYTIMIYLSDTNLESGTSIYDENNNLITDVKFVQNRALLFDANYNHKSSKNFGQNKDNGRLTLNVFMKRR